MKYTEGLVVAHALLLLSFLVGASFLSPRSGDTTDGSAPRQMMRLVCTCGLGFAVIGFVCLLLAMVGLLNLWAIAVALAACAAIAGLAQRETPVQADYWQRRLHALGSCWDGPALGLYYFMLVVAFPAINLARIGSDPSAYHLAYAADWAVSGRLLVDPFLDPPFYASNFVLLDSFVLLLHAQPFVIFLVWLTGLLTAFGVFASVRWFLTEQGIEFGWSALAAAFVTISLVLAPSYFEWLDSSYIDVPIGAFALLATLAIALGARERRYDWLVAGAVLAGFLIGMKVSFLPFVVVFAIAIWIAARNLHLARGATLLLFAVLIAASSPWYIRNWVAAGDPLAPILNLKLHGSDGLITPSEAGFLIAGLHHVASPLATALLPFSAFSDPTVDQFNADGETALIVALFLPALILLLKLHRRGWMASDGWVAVVVLYLLAGYWILTSVTLRYANLFLPLLAVCLALTVGLLLRPWRWRGPAIAILMALCMIPDSSAVAYFHRIYYARFTDLPATYLGDAEFQHDQAYGYLEATYVSSLLRGQSGSGLVYVVSPGRGEDLHYYFRLNGIRSAGTWVGPGSWPRLFTAVDDGTASAFMHDLHIRAVLVDQTRTFLGLDIPLERQLLARGYCRGSIPGSSFDLLLECDASEGKLSHRA